jgi:phosphoglycolate phosphatase
MTPSAAVFFDALLFDVDGVLLDTLAPHLKAIEDQARAQGLEVAPPDARAVKELVRRGVRISPMKEFFLAVGFPEPAAAAADENYRREFAARYPMPVFAGVAEMLAQLSRARLALGIVTSNTAANVAKGLGGLLEHFRPDCRYTTDDARALTKPRALAAAAGTLGLEPAQVLYVGDQPADAEAARAAGTAFLGVTYGWGIGPESGAYPTADSPDEVASYILAHARPVPRVEPPTQRR